MVYDISGITLCISYTVNLESIKALYKETIYIYTYFFKRHVRVFCLTLIHFIKFNQKQWERAYWFFIDQIIKDEETLYVIMSKEGSVVNNKFWTMLICNFRESLQHHIQTQNDSGQPLWAPKNYLQKMIKRGFFYKFLN